MNLANFSTNVLKSCPSNLGSSQARSLEESCGLWASSEEPSGIWQISAMFEDRAAGIDDGSYGQRATLREMTED